MSAASDLLAKCDCLKVNLSPDGNGGLRLSAPRGLITRALISLLKQHKSELQALLAERAGSTDAFCSEGRLGDVPEVPDKFGWDDDRIDPDEIPICATCGLIDAWQSVLGEWRCTRCDPPNSRWTAQEVLNLKSELLKRCA
jgi:hypothetical protein